MRLYFEVHSNLVNYRHLHIANLHEIYLVYYYHPEGLCVYRRIGAVYHPVYCDLAGVFCSVF